MKRRNIVDPVRVQFSVSIRLKRGKKLAPELIEMLIKKWMQGERIPKGVKINAVVWQNPDRTRIVDRNWRGAGDRKAIARLLHGEAFQLIHETPEEAQSSLMAITATQPIRIKTVGRNR